MTVSHWQNKDVHLILVETDSSVQVCIKGRECDSLHHLQEIVGEELAREHVELVPEVQVYRHHHPVASKSSNGSTLSLRENPQAGEAVQHAIERITQREHLERFHPAYCVNYAEWRASLHSSIIAGTILATLLIILPLALLRYHMLENQWLEPWGMFSSSAEPFILAPIALAIAGVFSWERYHRNKLFNAACRGDATIRE